MPIRYIGRTTDFLGKKLGYLLYNLPGFGVGRLVYRNMKFSRYPEPSYYVITRVEPQKVQQKVPYNKPCPSRDRSDTKVDIWGRCVWRGEDLGNENCLMFFP